MDMANREKEVEELAIKLAKQQYGYPTLESITEHSIRQFRHLARTVIDAGYTRFSALDGDWPEKKDETKMGSRAGEEDLELGKVIGWNACHAAFLQKINEVQSGK